MEKKRRKECLCKCITSSASLKRRRPTFPNWFMQFLKTVVAAKVNHFKLVIDTSHR
jgi:hypothetical protein